MSHKIVSLELNDSVAVENLLQITGFSQKEKATPVLLGDIVKYCLTPQYASNRLIVTGKFYRFLQDVKAGKLAGVVKASKIGPFATGKAKLDVTYSVAYAGKMVTLTLDNLLLLAEKALTVYDTLNTAYNGVYNVLENKAYDAARIVEVVQTVQTVNIEKVVLAGLAECETGFEGFEYTKTDVVKAYSDTISADLLATPECKQAFDSYLKG